MWKTSCYIYVPQFKFIFSKLKAKSCKHTTMTSMFILSLSLSLDSTNKVMNLSQILQIFFRNFCNNIWMTYNHRDGSLHAN